MASISVLILIAAGTVWLETPGLWKRGRMKELAFFFLLLAVGLVLSSLWLLRISMPNPMYWIKLLYG